MESVLTIFVVALFVVAGAIMFWGPQGEEGSRRWPRLPLVPVALGFLILIANYLLRRPGQ